LFNGGQHITKYTISYTLLERVVTALSRDGFVEKTYSFKTGPDKSAIIRNIPGDTEVTKIGIVATNFAGLDSKRWELERSYRTQQSSRHAMLLREIENAESLDTRFIDTDFLTGVAQRLLKTEYLKKLYKELKTVVPYDLEVEEAKEWFTIQDSRREKVQKAKEIAEEMERIRQGRFKDSDSEEEGPDGQKKPKKKKKKNRFEFTAPQRRLHYDKKMRKLEEQIRSLKDELIFIDNERGRLTQVMKEKQKRRLLLRVERDRLANYKDEFVVSSIIHGYPTQYVFDDFMLEVEKEMKLAQDEVATAKMTVMNGETRKGKAKEELRVAEETLLDRTSMYMLFERKQKAALKTLERAKGFSSIDPEEIKIKYFALWLEYIRERERLRRKVNRTFVGMTRRLQRQAFFKWRTGKHEEAEEVADLFIGVGSKMLLQAEEKRRQLQGELREAISSAAVLRQNFTMSGLTNKNRKLLVQSSTFKAQEDGLDHKYLFSMGIHYLHEADGYTSQGKFELARSLYEAQIWYLRSTVPLDIKLLAICHGRMGRMFMLDQKVDRAIVEFDRQLSLAREIDDQPEIADAYFGLGYGYMKRYNYDDALRYLDLSQGRLSILGNMRKYVACMRAMRDCFERIDKLDTMKMYDEKIDRIENEIKNKTSHIDMKLTDMRGRLLNANAEIELVVKIERTTLEALRLRDSIKEFRSELADREEAKGKQREVVTQLVKIMDAIQKELAQAFETDEIEMWSNVVNDGVPILIDVEELKTRLNTRKVVELANLDREKITENKIAIEIKNLDYKIEEAEDNLSLEEGNLMRRARHDRSFRAVALCPVNAAGNEVTGTASGGVENFIAAEGHNIHVLDYHVGELLHVFVGDDKNRFGEKVGHVGIVTCLVHDATYIYSGSQDETIMKWNMNTYERELVIVGHEGTIVSLAAADGPYLASGSADLTVRLWWKETGEQIRVVHGHSKSVLAMEVGNSWLATASADEEVRVWDIKKKGKHTIAVDCKRRLLGHETAVTCVRYGSLEVISGDNKGRLFVWWTQTGDVMRIIEAHRGPIRCLQFDAVHIVSGGVDSIVCITDIATGEVTQKLRGHEGHVHALAFDSERIVSCSGDNSIRYWKWGSQLEIKDKIHVLNAGETLASIAKQYNVPLTDLMKWNGIVEMRRQAYPGLNLIVRKADPNEPTAAEKMAIEKERRKNAGRSQTTKLVDMESAVDAFKYSRMKHRMDEVNKATLGNRMFTQEKHDFELFPDAFDVEQNDKGLSARLQRPAAELGMGRRVAAEGRYFMSPDNEEVWGDVADSLAIAMLAMLAEYEAYEVAKEETKGLIRFPKGISGRTVANDQYYQDAHHSLVEMEEMAANDDRAQVLVPSKVLDNIYLSEVRAASREKKRVRTAEAVERRKKLNGERHRRKRNRKRTGGMQAQSSSPERGYESLDDASVDSFGSVPMPIDTASPNDGIKLPPIHSKN
jgi:WD40 repeat protein